MKKLVKDMVLRTRNILISDKTMAPEGFEQMIKSDCNALLENYFELCPSATEIQIEFKDGFYEITVTAKAFQVRNCGKSAL
ncbi:MAG TPA: hypothetical protein IAC70_05400 [Candidatus Faecicola pullistercoris]|nr:hypothetical protein [Candidatus Faecicola pullistercoris]